MSSLGILCVIPSISADQARLDRCLRSVRSSLPSESKIVLVWNSSKPFQAEEEGIEVYRPGINLGYGPAINVVAARNPSEFIWAVQDDMTFPEPYVVPFATAMRSDPSLAALTPGLVPAVSGEKFEARGGVIAADGSLMPRPVAEEITVLREVEFVPGGWIPLSGALVRTSSFLEIGGFDPAFFPVGHSDVDLCWRLEKAGYGVGAVVNYGATHQKAASTPSRLGSYLYKENGAYFMSKVAGRYPAPRAVDVPPELLQAVAAAASSKLLGFAGYVETQDRKLVGAFVRRIRRFAGKRWDLIFRR